MLTFMTVIAAFLDITAENENRGRRRGRTTPPAH